MEDTQRVFDCLSYISRGLYGAVANGDFLFILKMIDFIREKKFDLLDVKVLCTVARDIANCTQQHLGDCIAAEVGRRGVILKNF